MEPTGAQIETEFGVTILGSGEVSGTVGRWFAEVAPKLYVQGEDLADLRDQLIKYKWLRDDASQLRTAARAARERRDPGPDPTEEGLS